jgi:DNA repair photolyase
MPQNIQTKTILNKSKHRDKWFLDDYTLNPFSGCSFNCLYCYIRGSKYGTNMEEKLSVKENAEELLEKALSLRSKKKQYGFIVLSSATDPYLQFEKDLGLTRRLLKIIQKYRFPVHIITKSDLVIRDIDILKEINNVAILPADLESKLNHKTLVTFSFSTIDDSVGKIFEPGATLPGERLNALSSILESGLHTGVSMMPLLPMITDTPASINNMLSEFSSRGAKYILPASLTLFGNQTSDSKTLTLRAIEKNFPSELQSYKTFFNYSNGMPHLYLQEFDRKLEILLKKHNLKRGIL